MDNCPYSCKSTDNKSLISQADAVLFHGWIFPESTLPSYRNRAQRWIYFNTESPVNTYLHSNKIKYESFNGVFNWTFTYRTDSDVKILKWLLKNGSKDKQLANMSNWFNSKKLGMALISNCKNNERIELVKKLQEYIPNSIDFYGRCGTKRCEKKECLKLFKQYKFFFAFENSFYCKDYITEKFWLNGFMNYAIPVAKGPFKIDYLNQGIPNDSFIHVDDFKSVKQLADYLVQVNNSLNLYSSFHKWRQTKKIITNYVGFYCDICKKLHEDNKEKVYWNFKEWYNSCLNFSFT